jgi:hypothetical protein
MRRGLMILIGSLALLGIAAEKEWKLPTETTNLKPGRGAELIAANCLLCHSADYISTQPRLSQTAWKAAVEKMRLKYGAPIATNKVDDIVRYLVASYGAGPK